MHETLLEDVKLNIDQTDRYNNTYFVAGWILSLGAPIESMRISADDQYYKELAIFDHRPDVNKFYNLPEHSRTGFKFILNPERPIERLSFSIKRVGQSTYQEVTVIRERVPTPVTDPTELPAISFNNTFPGLIAVENFYSDPDAVRDYAMRQTFNPHVQYHKGCRTENKTIFPGTKESFEKILRRRITVWDDHIHNGVFQYCTADQPLVYHTDAQSFAAIVFLTPDAPPETGTSFFRSKHNGLMAAPTPADCTRLAKSEADLVIEMFAGNFYDSTRWELVDRIGNVYNRLVIFDAQKVHAASAYFGDKIHNSRLFHMFFFDAE